MNSRRLILAQGVALREFYLVLGLVTRKFGLNNGSDGMSALGHKRTFCNAIAMSALPPIATSIAFFDMSALGHKRTLHGPEMNRPSATSHRDRHTVDLDKGS